MMDPAESVAPLLFGECEGGDWIGPVEISQSKVVQGRGLVATRDIHPGECLLVLRAVVSASLPVVYERWSCNFDETRSLQDIAEQVLVEAMRAATPDQAASFLHLLDDTQHRVIDIEIMDSNRPTPTNKNKNNATNSNNNNGEQQQQLLQTLLGNGCSTKHEQELVDLTIDSVPESVLRGIVRRNAFGPDFHNYEKMEQHIRKRGSNYCKQYHRILGLYPVAALLNHSCQSNAVRVFCEGHSMVVHSNAFINKGDEITWSYIPPTQPFPNRQEALQSNYGFTCRCERCRVEAPLYDAQNMDQSFFLQSLEPLNHHWELGLDEASNLSLELLSHHISQLEDILKHERLTNEERRYLRVGFLHLYIHYFNYTLLSVTTRNNHDANDNDEDEAKKQKEHVLQLATQLHFSLVASHNASTEHLSILHLLYELASVLYPGTPKIRFWTEQLKRAHMVRYGPMGQRLEHVRTVMVHTRTILRQQDGLQLVTHKFL